MKQKFFSLAALTILSILTSCDKYFENVEPVVQTVSIAGPVISSDGLTTDNMGNIFATNNIGSSNDPFNGNGTTVYKITPQGRTDSFC